MSTTFLGILTNSSGQLFPKTPPVIDARGVLGKKKIKKSFVFGQKIDAIRTKINHTNLT